MKYYFIINPNSGKIDTNQFEQRILKECSKEKIKYKIFYTHNAGDAKKFAKKIPDEECVVFSVGGDGNLNAVLNGLAGSKNKILGNIPTGVEMILKEHLTNMMTEYMILILELLMEDILLMLPV